MNDKFDALLSGEIGYPDSDMMIGKSTNLGCIDFYPAVLESKIGKPGRL